MLMGSNSNRGLTREIGIHTVNHNNQYTSREQLCLNLLLRFKGSYKSLLYYSHILL